MPTTLKFFLSQVSRYLFFSIGTSGRRMAGPHPHLPHLSAEYLASLTEEDRRAIASIGEICARADQILADHEDDGKHLHIKSLGISIPRRHPGEPIVYK